MLRIVKSFLDPRNIGQMWIIGLVYKLLMKWHRSGVDIAIIQNPIKLAMVAEETPIHAKHCTNSGIGI